MMFRISLLYTRTLGSSDHMLRLSYTLETLQVKEVDFCSIKLGGVSNQNQIPILVYCIHIHERCFGIHLNSTDQYNGIK